MKKTRVLGTLLFSLFLASCSINTNEVISIIQNIDVTDGGHQEQPSQTEIITDLHYHIFTLARQSGYAGTYEQFVAAVKGGEISLALSRDDKLLWKLKSESDSAYRTIISLELIGKNDGVTPYVSNGHWFIGNTDTGIVSSLNSAFEVYKRYNPNFKGNESDWLKTILTDFVPVEQPSVQPSVEPSVEPSVQPSVQPSEEPSVIPSEQPSEEPSEEPSVTPSEQPSEQESINPEVTYVVNEYYYAYSNDAGRWVNVGPITVYEGQKIRKPNPDTKGCPILNWYTEEGKIWNFDDPVKSNLTIYGNPSHQHITLVSKGSEGHIETCTCGYISDWVDAHSFNNMGYNTESCWQECSCGYHLDEEHPHSFDENGNCIYCGNNRQQLTLEEFSSEHDGSRNDPFTADELKKVAIAVEYGQIQDKEYYFTGEVRNIDYHIDDNGSSTLYYDLYYNDVTFGGGTVGFLMDYEGYNVFDSIGYVPFEEGDTLVIRGYPRRLNGSSSYCIGSPYLVDGYRIFKYIPIPEGTDINESHNLLMEGMGFYSNKTSYEINPARIENGNVVASFTFKPDLFIVYELVDGATELGDNDINLLRQSYTIGNEGNGGTPKLVWLNLGSEEQPLQVSQAREYAKLQDYSLTFPSLVHYVQGTVYELWASDTTYDIILTDGTSYLNIPRVAKNDSFSVEKDDQITVKGSLVNNLDNGLYDFTLDYAQLISGVVHDYDRYYTYTFSKEPDSDHSIIVRGYHGTYSNYEEYVVPVVNNSITVKFRSLPDAVAVYELTDNSGRISDNYLNVRRQTFSFEVTDEVAEWVTYSYEDPVTPEEACILSAMGANILTTQYLVSGYISEINEDSSLGYRLLLSGYENENYSFIVRQIYDLDDNELTYKYTFRMGDHLDIYTTLNGVAKLIYINSDLHTFTAIETNVSNGLTPGAALFVKINYNSENRPAEEYVPVEALEDHIYLEVDHVVESWTVYEYILAEGQTQPTDWDSYNRASEDINKYVDASSIVMHYPNEVVFDQKGKVVVVEDDKTTITTRLLLTDRLANPSVSVLQILTYGFENGVRQAALYKEEEIPLDNISCVVDNYVVTITVEMSREMFDKYASTYYYGEDFKGGVILEFYLEVLDDGVDISNLDNYYYSAFYFSSFADSLHLERKGSEDDPLNADDALAIAKYLNPNHTDNQHVYVYAAVLDEPTADYCNFHLDLTDESEALYVYGLASKDREYVFGSKGQISNLPIQQGDEVLLYAQIRHYSNESTGEIVYELVNAELLEVNGEEFTVQISSTEIVNDGTLEHPYNENEAMTLIRELDLGVTSDTFVYVQATVNSAPTSDYCNFNLLTDNGEVVLVYGLATADGSQRYGTKRQISELPIKQGDVVLLQANLCNYNSYGTSKPELLNARLISIIE